VAALRTRVAEEGKSPAPLSAAPLSPAPLSAAALGAERGAIDVERALLDAKEGKPDPADLLRQRAVEEELRATKESLAQREEEVRKLNVENWDDGSNSDIGDVEEALRDLRERCRKLESEVAEAGLERDEAQASLLAREQEWVQELERSRRELAGIEEDFRRSGKRLSSLEAVMTSPPKTARAGLCSEGSPVEARRGAVLDGEGAGEGAPPALSFNAAPRTPGARSAAARGLEESFGSVSAVLEGEGDTARFEVLRRMVDDQEKEKTLLIGKVAEVTGERDELSVKLEALKLTGQFRNSQDARRRDGMMYRLQLGPPSGAETNAGEQRLHAARLGEDAGAAREEVGALREKVEWGRKEVSAAERRTAQGEARLLEALARLGDAEAEARSTRVHCVETEARATLATASVARLEPANAALEVKVLQLTAAIGEDARRIARLEQEVREVRDKVAGLEEEIQRECVGE
ncbi:hypothetical protein T484DRAFT_1782046, partial [Baffinella frigidus]